PPPLRAALPILSTSGTCTLSLHDALPILLSPSISKSVIDLLPSGFKIDNLHRAIQFIRQYSNYHYPCWFQSLAHLIETLTELLRSEEHTSELQSRFDLVCRLLLEKKKIQS